MPVWSKTWPKSAGFMSRLIPKTSKTSAEPGLGGDGAIAMLGHLDAACSQNEGRRGGNIKTIDWSPPVPQLSMASRTWVGISRALACMTRPNLSILLGSLPLILRPRRKATTWAWLTWPVAIFFNHRSHFFFCQILACAQSCKDFFHLPVLTFLLDQSYKVFHHLEAIWGTDGFGMELEAKDGEF